MTASFDLTVEISCPVRRYLGRRRDLDAGADLIDSALAIDPNSAGGWYYGGWVKIMLGEPEQAITYQARSMRRHSVPAEHQSGLEAIGRTEPATHDGEPIEWGGYDYMVVNGVRPVELAKLADEAVVAAPDGGQR